MATPSPQEIEDIRRKMALIRHDLHQDVRGVVEGAEAATDWRRYIKGYPWAGVGLAFAVGYFLVPRRQPSNSTTIHVAPAAIPQAIAAAAPTPAVEEKKRERKSLIRMAIGLALPLALKAGKGYALQFAEQWLAQKMAQQGGGGMEGLAAMLGATGQPPSAPHPQGPPHATPGRPPGGPRF